ncbi:cellulase family glycosylhydrolase [Agromyces intestinalis]|uniref:Cellulase family glycosylhydrolase n=1 Tax=Agromyces intestinalis TaxID=2592652 RepID=A0A5C1YK56_9MICO|nr:ricin-type beta-trefoil lectin domain protein [Agromyces intestinalis]QEO15457.1 cellulase family glycosylhydrolase [Agromyces intestinalis]
MTQNPSGAPSRRTISRRVIGMLIGLLLLPLAVVVTAQPASAATSQFRGFNWAVLGDNFNKNPLVLDGLSASDSYATVKAKANALYDDMQSTMGANTVRLPVNTHTVGGSFWSAYRGTIDAATERGWKVILAYWEDGAASGGRVTNSDAFHAMWTTVINAYGGNSNVYFEPMNEPHGYSSQEWRDVAARWLDRHTGAPKARVLIGGTGYSQDLRDICNDSRFNSTLLSFHHYAFMYSAMTYDAFLSHIKTRLGNCASRAVVTEFGSPMNNGLDYANAGSTDNFVRYLRAIAQVMRENNMGGTYWPALGGKPGDIGYDWYSMFAKSGSGTNLNLSIRNQSGADRVRYAWGDNVGGGSGGGSGSGRTIVNQNSGKCLDVVGGSTENGAEVIQYTCGSGANQRWTLTDRGNGYYNIVSAQSGKCLDVTSASTADGATIKMYTCGNGTNQQFERRAAGSYSQLVARHSGKCVDIPASSTDNGIRIKQYPCNSGANQRWSL